MNKEAVEQLEAEIQRLMQGVENVGKAGRTKLVDIRRLHGEIVPQDLFADGRLVDGEWNELGDEKQRDLHDRLETVRDSLAAIGVMAGPADPEHWMYGEFASNTAIFWIGALAFVLTVTILSLVVHKWPEATGTDSGPLVSEASTALQEAAAAREQLNGSVVKRAKAVGAVEKAKADEALAQARELLAAADREVEKAELEHENGVAKAHAAAVAAVRALIGGGPSEQLVLLMVVLMGALGGCLHLISSFAMFIGNRQLMRSWIPHYVFLPLKAAALAPVVYMLLRVGILAPSGAESDGSGTANLNLVSVYAFAALTGLFAKTALEKLYEVFQTLFRTSRQSRDRLGQEVPPGSKTSG